MYTIRREILFENQFTKISKDYNRIADLESAIDWFLVRANSDEKYVTRIGNPGDHFLWKFNDIHKDFPQLLILYKVDNKKEMIYLISVKEVE